MSGQKIYNVNAEASFVDVLAERYLEEYAERPEELAQVLFLLPNRRACQSLAEAFVRCRGLTPTILPQMKPIAETDEDEVFLTGDAAVIEDLLPAVNQTDRVLQFTRLILKKSSLNLDKMSLAQAYALAQNLSELLDTVYNEQQSFAKFDTLETLVGAEYAEHWQQTVELLKIITQNWPNILAQNRKTNAVERKNSLLRAEIDYWQKTQPQRRIVVAGTTAAFPILKELVQTVLQLPNGEVYLYGLDKYLSDAEWKKIDENHPQYELKELLQYLKISRADVQNLNQIPFTVREKIVAETMRPAETTKAWCNLSAHPIAREDFSHIKLLNCDDMRQEAEAIALIIRHTLETPKKTAVLVTMDRDLSRRVVSELQKWNIAADDSAGKPLSLTPIGIYLQLICDYMENKTDTALISLMKHPFTNCGQSIADFNARLRKLEYTLRKDDEFDAETQNFYDEICRRLQPLTDLYAQPYVSLEQIFITHIKVAEDLADTDLKKGAQIIWKNDAGNVAAKFVGDFAGRCGQMDSIKTNDYSAFLSLLLAEQSVRTRFGTHPRVKILGPIEARLAQYDVTIIGEANEGVWPKIPEADMWMSRPMKKDFELPQPERQIGVMAADFAHLMHAPEVYITRAQKVGKYPTNKSRWWLRFETVLKAIFGPKEKDFAFIFDQPYAYWAKNLDRRDGYHPISAPEPRPEVERRPTELWATNVEKWIRNPYEIYAKCVLSLYKMDEIDRERQPYELGNIIHDVLKEFNNIYNTSDYPSEEEARKQLLQMGREAFIANDIPPEIEAFWWPKYEDEINWVIEHECSCRDRIRTLHNEVKGSMEMNGPRGKFTISAIADRIEELENGELNIIDYKTGKKRSTDELEKGKAPQLPIEGLIAQKGGFTDVAPANVEGLQYWGLKDESISKVEGDKTAGVMDIVEQTVQNHINAYARKEQPYWVKPRPADVKNPSDYDHLSRLKEWSVHSNSAED